MKRSLHCFILTVSALLLLAKTAGAADPLSTDACTKADQYPFPEAYRVAASWRSGEVVASPTLLTEILEEFCKEAIALVNEKGLANEKIDKASSRVLSKILDREADEKSQRPTTGALLRAEFGAAGLSRPVYKRSARLEIKYVLEIDTLQVNAEIFPKATLLLLQPGKVHVKGIRNGKTVCTQGLTLVAGQIHRYTCEAHPP